MPNRTFTQNTATAESFGIEARCDGGYRVMSYSGNLGGGTLRLFTQPNINADPTPVPDGKLSAANLDGNNDPIQQVVFVSAGNVLVTLSGATNPNCTVTVE
ncbi:hypothetical protein [Agrobacterium sp. 22117]|uniref:hypothetical protein n=1 Tax=Agrobacterium sp. 22117 TaxID=3453880 RepID=UPI003F87BFD0